MLGGFSSGLGGPRTFFKFFVFLVPFLFVLGWETSVMGWEDSVLGWEILEHMETPFV